MATLTVSSSLLWSALEGTSSSTIAVSIASKSLTASTSRAWVAGMPLQLLPVGTKLRVGMFGTVTSYNSATGALVLNVTGYGATGSTTGYTNSMTDRFSQQALSQTSVTVASTGTLGPWQTRPGLTLTTGDNIRAVNRGTQTTFIEGTVAAYNSTTGSLTITATSSGGSGAVTDWIFVSTGTISNWVVAPNDGDTVQVTSGATLTLDATNQGIIGNLTCPTLGTIAFSNSSTTTPQFFRFNSRNSRLTVQNTASITARGAPIVIATGTGGALTYTFPSPTWDPMGIPTYVEVETGSGTDVFARWCVFPSLFYGLQRYGYFLGADLQSSPTAIALVNGGGGTGVGTLGTLTAGSGYTNGVYENVAFTLVSGTGDGATGTVVVAGGVVTAVTITNPGTGYTTASVLTCPAASVGGTVTVAWQITLTGIGVRSASYRVSGGTGSNGVIRTGSTLAGGVAVLAGVATIGAITGGTGYVSGTYTQVPLTASNGTGAASAQAKIVVTGGIVTAVTITNPGNGYIASGTLSCANTFLGGSGSGWSVPLSTVSGTLTQGSGYANGTYTDVYLSGGAGSACRATIVVSGGVVTSVTPTYPGASYATGNSLTTANTNLGGSGSGFAVTIGAICNTANGACWAGYSATPTAYALGDVLTCLTGDTMQPKFQVIEIGDFQGPVLQTNIQSSVIYTGATVNSYYLAYSPYTCTGGTGTGAVFVSVNNGTVASNNVGGFFVAGTGYSVGDILTVGGGGMQVQVTEVSTAGAVSVHNKVCTWDPAGRKLRFEAGGVYGAAVPNGARVRVPNLYIDALPTEAPLVATMTAGGTTATFESAYAINDIPTGDLVIDSEAMTSSTKTANTLVMTYNTQNGRQRYGSTGVAHSAGAVAVLSMNGRATGSQRAQTTLNPGGAIDCQWVSFGGHFYVNSVNARSTRFQNCGWLGQLAATATTGPVTINNCSQASNPFDPDNNFMLTTSVQNALSIDGFTMAQVQGHSNTASLNMVNPITCPNITAFKNISVVLSKVTRGDWRTFAPSGCTFANDDTAIMTNCYGVGGFLFWQSTSNTRISNYYMAGGTAKTLSLSNQAAAFSYTTGAMQGFYLNNCTAVVGHNLFQVPGAQPIRGDLLQVDSGCANCYIHDVTHCASWAGIPMLNRVGNTSPLGLTIANVSISGTLRTAASLVVNATQTSDTYQNVRANHPLKFSTLLLGTLVGGSGYTDGTYTAVALTGGTGKNAVANVVVVGGAVTLVGLSTAGYGYTVGDVLTGTVAGGSGWSVQVASVGIPISSGQGIGHGSLDKIDYVGAIQPFFNAGGAGTPNLPDATWFQNLVDYGPSPTTGRLSIGCGGPNGATTQYVITSPGTVTTLSVGNLVAGSAYTNGTYYNVALTGGTGTGATANITVATNTVTVCALVIGGAGYVIGDVLSCLASDVGGTGTGFSVTVSAVAGLNTYTDNGGRMYVGGQGESVTLTNWYPLRGITGFRSLTPQIYGGASVGTSFLGTGWINFKVTNAGSGYTNSNVFYPISGGSGTGGLFYQTANTSGAITGGYLMGVGYQVGDVITLTGNGSANATLLVTAVPIVRFRMVPWGQDITVPALQTLTAANLISAFAAMTGYSSNVGLQFQLSITSTAPDATRFLNFLQLYTNVDPAFAPPVEYVPITVTAAGSGAVMGVVKSSALLGTALISGGGTATIKSPYDLDGTTQTVTTRVRKLGLLPVEATMTYRTVAGATTPVSALTDTTATVTNPATVAAYTTLETTDKLWDYLRYWGTTDAGLLSPTLEALTAGGIDIRPNALVVDATAAQVFSYNSGTQTLTIKASLLAAGAKTSGVLASTVTAVNGATLGVWYTSAGARSVLLKAPAILPGSRYQLWDVTNGMELDNSIAGASGVSFRTTWTSDVTVRLRALYKSGTSAWLPAEATGVLTSTGLTFLSTQSVDTVYGTYGWDGSAVTGFTSDFPNVQVDVSAVGTFLASKFYAWYVNELMSANGIRNFWGAVTAVSAAMIRINNSIVNLYFDNITAQSVKQSDTITIYREDGDYPVAQPTSGGGGISMYNGQAYFASATVPTATANAAAVRTELATELARIDAATSTRLASVGYVAPDNANISAIKAKTDNLPAAPASVSDIPTANDNASAVRTNLTAELGRIDVATSTRLATAVYTAPDNAAVTNIKAKTDNLPSDPASQSTIPTPSAIADKILTRSIGGGADGGRTVQDALRAQRNRVVISGNTITVYAEDDTTVAWTAQMTTEARDAIQSVDPA